MAYQIPSSKAQEKAAKKAEQVRAFIGETVAFILGQKVTQFSIEANGGRINMNLQRVSNRHGFQTMNHDVISFKDLAEMATWLGATRRSIERENEVAETSAAELRAKSLAETLETLNKAIEPSQRRVDRYRTTHEVMSAMFGAAHSRQVYEVKCRLDSEEGVLQTMINKREEVIASLRELADQGVQQYYTGGEQKFNGDAEKTEPVPDRNAAPTKQPFTPCDCGCGGVLMDEVFITSATVKADDLRVVEIHPDSPLAKILDEAAAKAMGDVIKKELQPGGMFSKR